MAIAVAIAVAGAHQPDLDAASEVEVYEVAGEPASFRLRYELSLEDGDLPLLGDGRLDAGAELTILASAGDEAVCLVKGPVHRQVARLAHRGPGSTLEVHGADRLVELDRETRAAVWPDGTDSEIATSILSAYFPNVDAESTSASHSEQKHTLVQLDSDLRFVRRLARRNGYLLWVTADADGVETVFFRSPPLDGEPAATLVINQDNPNLSELELVWDVERPTSVIGQQLDLNSKGDLDGAVSGPPQTLLAALGLAAITGDTRSVHLHAPADDAGNLQARGTGLLREADWFVRVRCKVSLNALGRIVRPCTVVELNGAGLRHSGRYFVAAVRHCATTAEYTMELELVRNAWEG